MNVSHTDAVVFWGLNEIFKGQSPLRLYFSSCPSHFTASAMKAPPALLMTLSRKTETKANVARRTLSI